MPIPVARVVLSAIRRNCIDRTISALGTVAARSNGSLRARTGSSRPSDGSPVPAAIHPEDARRTRNSAAPVPAVSQKTALTCPGSISRRWISASPNAPGAKAVAKATIPAASPMMPKSTGDR